MKQHYSPAIGTDSSNFASGLTNKTSSPVGCVQDAQFAPNRYNLAVDPFLCVKETYGDDDLSSRSKNETEVGMENFAFKAETNSPSFVEASTTTLLKE